MKLGKYTLGKNTVTIHNVADYYGNAASVRTVAYRHIASVVTSDLYGDHFLHVQLANTCLEYATRDVGEAAKLREFAAELHQRMEQCG